jgi:ABC-type glutathione transport system ATPase component
MLYISHDLAVVRQLADTVAVLYRDELIQLADTDMLLDTSLHPYTEMLLQAAPGTERTTSPPACIPGVEGHNQCRLPLAGRCWCQIGNICAENWPPVQVTRKGIIRCHIPYEIGMPLFPGRSQRPIGTDEINVPTIRGTALSLTRAFEQCQPARKPTQVDSAPQAATILQIPVDTLRDL